MKIIVNINKIIAYSTFVVVAIVLLSLKNSAFAQEAGRGITIIPPRFELFANPGDTVTEKVRIRNESSFPLTFNVVIEDFSSSGEEGHVVLEEESADTSFSLAKWIIPSTKDVVLQPGEEQPFSFTINVPKTAEPGGHYASILFASGGEQVPGAAAVAQRVGTLVLLRVSGNVTEQASIETFEAPTYSQKGPIPFTLRVKNEGNVHVQPKGTIIITNMLGKKVEEIPLQAANVLPEATRKTETLWEKQNLIGQYTATLVATYGQQNLPLTAATRFTVISPTALILIIVGLIALIIFILSLISGRKRLMKAFKVLASGK